MTWNQSNWDEPTLYELSKGRRTGYLVPASEIEEEVRIPNNLRRDRPIELPQLSELQVVRHFTRLSQMSFGVDLGMMPLGSCTMKYNPKVMEKSQVLTEKVHPLQDENTVQGTLEMIYLMQEWLKAVTGMDECSLQPQAGSAGELAGVLIFKKYHGSKRDEVMVADTAHGTNPASAAMVGYKVVYIKSTKEGLMDIQLLKSSMNERVAGLMITNPNTLGLFEKNILEIASVVHGAGGLLYYDGANLNGILGYARPGDMGFDIVHLNLHKTFGVPHGGGGPGAGAVCTKGQVTDFLPGYIVEHKDGKYVLTRKPKSIGDLAQFYGNMGNVARSFVYMLGLGWEGISLIGKLSTLATNYLVKRLDGVRGIRLSPDNSAPRKHEAVFSLSELLRETGVSAEDVAKAIVERGFYAPTIYFPPIVEEALMIEPTETEPIEEIRKYTEILSEISKVSYEDPRRIKAAPTKTSRSRVNTAEANRPSTITPTMRVKRLREQGKLGPLL